MFDVVSHPTVCLRQNCSCCPFSVVVDIIHFKQGPFLLLLLTLFISSKVLFLLLLTLFISSQVF